MEMSTLHDDPTTVETELQPQFSSDKMNNGFFKGIIAREERLKGMSKEERRALRGEKNNNPAVDAEHAATAEYAVNGQSFDPADEIRPDGGMGKFNMYKSIFGIA